MTVAGSPLSRGTKLGPVMSGLSGNEIYCLRLKGLRPGELVLGNSVYSTGFLGGLGASFRSIVGGEITQVTSVIHEGRLQSYDRMMAEAKQRGGLGVTGVTSELRRMRGNTEFLSVASAIHAAEPTPEHLSFSTSGDGQQLYCQLDSGYTPLKFVFGNVAYSMGLGGGIMGTLKSLGRGEIKEYSDIFNATRHLALERIVDDARSARANAVVGIETRVMPFQGVHEMMMMGTAARHRQLPPAHDAAPVTSDMTCEEMWNITHLGYYPLKLVLGTAVYSLGVVGGLKAAFKSLARGEINELTSLVYDAREHAIGLIADEARAIGAEDVVGIKTHIHEFGSLIEFMAIGTAIKPLAGLNTLSRDLPPQAVMKDKDTWISDESQIFMPENPAGQQQTESTSGGIIGSILPRCSAAESGGNVPPDEHIFPTGGAASIRSAFHRAERSRRRHPSGRRIVASRGFRPALGDRAHLEGGPRRTVRARFRRK